MASSYNIDETSRISSLDLYEDLLLHDNKNDRFVTLQEVNVEKQELEEQNRLLHEQLTLTRSSFRSLEKQHEILEENFKSLLETAKKELERKNKVISRLSGEHESRYNREKVKFTAKCRNSFSDKSLKGKRIDVAPLKLPAQKNSIQDPVEKDKCCTESKSHKTSTSNHDPQQYLMESDFNPRQHPEKSDCDPSKYPAKNDRDPRQHPAKNDRDPRQHPAKNDRDPRQHPAKNDRDPRQHPAKNGRDPRQYPTQNDCDPSKHPEKNDLDPRQHPAKNDRDPRQHPAKNDRDPRQHPAKNGRDPRQYPTQNDCDPSKHPEKNDRDPSKCPPKNNHDPKQHPAKNGCDPSKHPTQDDRDPRQHPAEKDYVPRHSPGKSDHDAKLRSSPRLHLKSAERNCSVKEHVYGERCTRSDSRRSKSNSRSKDHKDHNRRSERLKRSVRSVREASMPYSRYFDSKENEHDVIDGEVCNEKRERCCDLNKDKLPLHDRKSRRSRTYKGDLRERIRSKRSVEERSESGVERQPLLRLADSSTDIALLCSQADDSLVRKRASETRKRAASGEEVVVPRVRRKSSICKDQLPDPNVSLSLADEREKKIAPSSGALYSHTASTNRENSKHFTPITDAAHDKLQDVPLDHSNELIPVENRQNVVKDSRKKCENASTTRIRRCSGGYSSGSSGVTVMKTDTSRLKSKCASRDASCEVVSTKKQQAMLSISEKVLQSTVTGTLAPITTARVKNTTTSVTHNTPHHKTTFVNTNINPTPREHATSKVNQDAANAKLNSNISSCISPSRKCTISEIDSNAINHKVRRKKRHSSMIGPIDSLAKQQRIEESGQESAHTDYDITNRVLVNGKNMGDSSSSVVSCSAFSQGVGGRSPTIQVDAPKPENHSVPTTNVDKRDASDLPNSRLFHVTPNRQDKKKASVSKREKHPTSSVSNTASSVSLSLPVTTTTLLQSPLPTVHSPVEATNVQISKGFSNSGSATSEKLQTVTSGDSLSPVQTSAENAFLPSPDTAADNLPSASITLADNSSSSIPKSSPTTTLSDPVSSIPNTVADDPLPSCVAEADSSSGSLVPVESSSISESHCEKKTVQSFMYSYRNAALQCLLHLAKETLSKRKSSNEKGVSPPTSGTSPVTSRQLWLKSLNDCQTRRKLNSRWLAEREGSSAPSQAIADDVMSLHLDTQSNMTSSSWMLHEESMQRFLEDLVVIVSPMKSLRKSAGQCRESCDAESVKRKVLQSPK